MSHISWSFLDKHQATIEAMRAFDSMHFIINHTDEELQEVRNKMGGTASPKLDGLPSVHNPQAREDRLLAGIDKIDVLEERYRQAVEYMDWFKTAWEQLSEDEQYVLEAMYMNPNKNGSATIMKYFGIERTKAYYKKKAALAHLTTLLYGKL